METNKLSELVWNFCKAHVIAGGYNKRQLDDFN